MRRLAAVTFLALGLTAGAGGGYWYAQPTPAAVAPPAATNIAAAADRMVLYYRDPSGAPYWSATPKKDKQGRDYLLVFEDVEFSLDFVVPGPGHGDSFGHGMLSRICAAQKKRPPSWRPVAEAVFSTTRVGM